MFDIYFYHDKNGVEPVREYLNELAGKSDKDSRINKTKIDDYISLLAEHGLTLREPFIKHLDGEIWELRPLRNRVLFVSWMGNGFLLLHHFMKKTQKTPQREIDKAKREHAEMIERYGKNE